MPMKQRAARAYNAKQKKSAGEKVDVREGECEGLVASEANDSAARAAAYQRREALLCRTTARD